MRFAGTIGIVRLRAIVSCVICFVSIGCAAKPELSISTQLSSPTTIDINIRNATQRPIKCVSATIPESLDVWLSRTPTPYGEVLLLHRSSPKWRLEAEDVEQPARCEIPPGEMHVQLDLREYYVRYGGAGDLRPIPFEVARQIPVEPILQEQEHMTVALHYLDGRRMKTIYGQVGRETTRVGQGTPKIYSGTCQWNAFREVQVSRGAAKNAGLP